MNKILTISIAAYNMEKYIRDTLDSITNDCVIDELEVFVIDDGGVDGTLDIAHEYARKYPNSIFPVHKENGGYGSTVNYSVLHATGKYIKLLDGDDWFDQEGLVKLVTFLKENDVDMIITPVSMGVERKKMKTKQITWIEKEKILNVSELNKIGGMPMWMLTFKTSVLKLNWRNLPEKSFYTDTLYVLYALSAVTTLVCLRSVVYCYRLDREGNSSNRSSLAKHFIEEVKISMISARFYESQKENDCASIKMVLARAGQTYSSAMRGLMYNDASLKMKDKLIAYDRELRAISEDVYKESSKYGKIGKFLWLIRKTNYAFYWSLFIIQLLKK